MRTSSTGGETSAGAPPVTRLRFTGYKIGVTLRLDEESQVWTHTREGDDVWAVVCDDENLRRLTRRADNIVELLNEGVIDPDPEVVKSLNRCFSTLEKDGITLVQDPRVFLGMLLMIARGRRPSAFIDLKRMFNFQRLSVVVDNSFSLNVSEMLSDSKEEEKERLFQRSLRVAEEWFQYLGKEENPPGRTPNHEEATGYLTGLLMTVLLASKSRRISRRTEDRLGSLLWKPIECVDVFPETRYWVWETIGQKERGGDVGILLAEYAASNWERIRSIESEMLYDHALRCLITETATKDVGIERRIWDTLITNPTKKHLRWLYNIFIRNRFVDAQFWQRLDGHEYGEPQVKALGLLLTEGGCSLRSLWKSSWERTRWKNLFDETDYDSDLDLRNPPATVGDMTTAARVWTVLQKHWCEQTEAKVAKVLPHGADETYCGLLEFTAWAEASDWTVCGERVEEQVVADFRDAVASIPGELMPFGWSALRDSALRGHRGTGGGRRDDCEPVLPISSRYTRS